MSEEETETFQIEEYEFYFNREEAHPRRVHLRRSGDLKTRIKTVEGRDITDADISKLNEFFKDMGKWETFSATARNLFQDLGIGNQLTEETKKEFGYERYNIGIERIELCTDAVMATFHLKPEERRRRTRGSSETSEIPLKEITEQVKNTAKWQMLRKTLLNLGKQI